MIVIDAVPKKLYWYRLYCEGQLLEAACAPRLLTVEEESLLYIQWAHKFGAPGAAFVEWIGTREAFKERVETGLQQKMRQSGEAARQAGYAPRSETGHMKSSFKDNGYGFDEKEYGYDPGHPGGDWSAFWFRRGPK